MEKGKKRISDATLQKSNKKHGELKGLGPVLVYEESWDDLMDPWYKPKNYEYEDKVEVEVEDEDEYEQLLREIRCRRGGDDDRDFFQRFEAYKRGIIEERENNMIREPYEDEYEDEEEKAASKEFVRVRNVKYAEKALEMYNKKMGTNYGAVEDLVSNNLDEEWAHCNFTAKQQNEERKLFFIEIQDDTSCVFNDSTKFTITACCILRGKAKHGCADHSYSKVVHPARGFRMGHHEYKGDRTSRSSHRASPFYFP